MKELIRKLQDWRWHMAFKLGWWLVSLWAEWQYKLDGDDTTQVEEIFYEMIAEFKRGK